MKIEPRKNYLSWDECFMQMANVIAQRSKDPSTQAGAVVVNQDNVVVGLGYNGWPRGIEVNQLPWEREGKPSETKYVYICHAEENAVYNANNSTKDCKIYCTLFPCNECAKTIIQNGIKEVIFESDKYHDTESCIASRKMLDLAGIKYREYISKSNNI
jgi:dCMP deaminase